MAREPMVFIDSLIVSEAYRRLGVGAWAIANVLPAVNTLSNSAYIFAMPNLCPYDQPEDQAAWNAAMAGLVEFWRAVCFIVSPLS